MEASFLSFGFLLGFFGFDGICFRGIEPEEDFPGMSTVSNTEFSAALASKGSCRERFLSKLKTLLLFSLPIIGENDEIEKKKLIRLIHYAFILFCFLLLFLLMNTW